MSRAGWAVATVGAAVGGAVVAWAAWWEPRRARLVYRDLRLERWPAALDGLRVAVLSDLHTGAGYVGTERVRRLVMAVNGEEVDVVALLGDYVDSKVSHSVDPDAIAASLSALRGRLGVVAVLGNHDWIKAGRAMPAALERHGIGVLENSAVELAPGLWVAGAADASMRTPRVGVALGGVPEDAAVLLLSHDPDVFPHVPDRVALTLSGHTHGGQVDLPLLSRLTIPSRHGARFKAGHIVEGGRHLFVTRGVGTSRYPIRLLTARDRGLAAAFGCSVRTGTAASTSRSTLQPAETRTNLAREARGRITGQGIGM